MQLKIFHASDHDIDPNQIDDDAVYVLKKLREAGFSAFLVGGSVRDLLLKRIPKDFDISTSAKPEEIKQIFQRQCLLIGRRFRLAHIRFKHKVIEVSTFRAGDNEEDLILHDNIWGTPEEDVLRRDFTINGLFYDPVEHAVIDYVGGWNDIHKHTLRTIGNPATRFKQDPVRMIRLLKFKARFGFSIDGEAEKALDLCCGEILKSSPARVLEEILRMLESGASEPFFRLMHQKGVIDLLFPCLNHFFNLPEGEEIYRLLAAADRLNLKSEKRPLDRAILCSCLFFPILQKEIETVYLSKNAIPHLGQIMHLTGELTKGIISASFCHFPRRVSVAMNYILSTQYRVTPLSGKRQIRSRIVQNREFWLALKFLKIRALVDETLMDEYQQWKHQYLEAEGRLDTGSDRAGEPGPVRRRSRRSPLKPV